MLRADVFVLERRRLFHGGIQNGLECGGDIQFRAGVLHFRCFLNHCLKCCRNAGGIRPQFLKDRRDNPIGLRNQCQHEVFNTEFWTLCFAGETLRCLQCLLCLNCPSVKSHGVPPSLFSDIYLLISISKIRANA